MAQTVKSQWVPSGWIIRILNKPRVLNRIFFSVKVLDPATDYRSQISLGDPSFSSYYILDGAARYFEAKGEGIFQGDIWVRNVSGVNLLYSVSEILI